MKDPYRNIAGVYDRLFDSMNQGLRRVGLKMFPPREGMSVLDVGCGTGSHLELYQEYGCQLYGIDLSPSMLSRAQERLGSSAQLDLGDATAMPYDDAKFDLVISMLSLHEMAPETRSAVLDEIARVLKDDGRVLLIDFHTGPYQPLQGWISKLVIVASEIAAGREHYRNYRRFMSSGGLPHLVTAHNLKVDKQKVLAGGTFVNLLLAP